MNRRIVPHVLSYSSTLERMLVRRSTRSRDGHRLIEAFLYRPLSLSFVKPQINYFFPQFIVTRSKRRASSQTWEWTRVTWRPTNRRTECNISHRCTFSGGLMSLIETKPGEIVDSSALIRIFKQRTGFFLVNVMSNVLFSCGQEVLFFST